MLLGKRKQTDATRAAQQPRARRSDGADASESDFVRKIRGQLDGGAVLHAGRLNVIGLNRVKARFGDDWHRVAAHADRIARNVIERHLAPGDIYASSGEDTYVTVFAQLSEAEARVKCFLIANEIARNLLGEDGAEHLEIKTAVTRLDGSVDFAEISSLGQLLDAALPLDPAEAETPNGRSAEAVSVDEPVDEGLALVPIERRRSTPKIWNETRANVLAGMDFVFRPVWDPVHNIIATYYCVPRVRLSDIEGAAGDAELAVAGDPDAIARLDAATIERVKQEFTAMAAEGRRLIITTPIHFETLSAAAPRRRCAAAIAGIDETMKRSLTIEITGVPSGVQKSRIMEIAAPLRVHCRNIALQMALETIDFAQIAGTGIATVGADITYLAKPEFIQMQQMSRFRRAAEKIGIATFLHGARSRSLVGAALGAGFHFIDGDAVAATVRRPDRALAFQLADLYGLP